MPSAAARLPAVFVVQVETRDLTPSTQFVGQVAAIGAVDLRVRR